MRRSATLLVPLIASATLAAADYPGSYPTTSTSAGTGTAAPAGSGTTSTNPYAVAGAPTRPAFAPAGYRISFATATDPYGPVTFTISGACEKPAIVAPPRMTSFSGGCSVIERWNRVDGAWKVVWREGTLDETATTIDAADGGITVDADRYAVGLAGMERTGRAHRRDSASELHDWTERWAGGVAASREGYEKTWTTVVTPLPDNGATRRAESTRRLTWTGPLPWTREMTSKTTIETLDGAAPGDPPKSMTGEDVTTARSYFGGGTALASERVVSSRSHAVRWSNGLPFESGRSTSEVTTARADPAAQARTSSVGARVYRVHDDQGRLREDAASFAVRSADGSSVGASRVTTYEQGQPASFAYLSGGYVLSLRWTDGRLTGFQDVMALDPNPREGRPTSEELAGLLKAYNHCYSEDPAWRMGGVPAEAYPFRPYVEMPGGGG